MAATETLLQGATQVSSSLSANYTAGGGTISMAAALVDHGGTPLTGPFEILVGRNRPSSERRYFVAIPSGSNLTVAASPGYTDNQNFLTGDLIDVVSAWETQRRQNAFDTLHTHTGGVDGTGLPTSALASGTLVAARFATAPGILTPAMIADQSANVGLFGPVSGGAAAPSMRAAVLADLPAITQRLTAVGSTGGPTTTSTTAVAIVDPVVTITTQASGEILVWWSANVSNSGAGNFTSVQLDCDAALVDIVHSVTCRTAFDVYQATGFARITGLSAAAHTLQLYWFVSAGTGTANGTGRSILAVEVRK